jgi:hypothetical protein
VPENEVLGISEPEKQEVARRHRKLHNEEELHHLQSSPNIIITAVARVRAGVNPVGFVVDKVALGQVFLRVLRLSPVNIIPPWAPHFRKFKK